MSSYSNILEQLRLNAQDGFFELGLAVENINGLTVDGYKAKRAHFKDFLKEAQIKTSPGKLRITGDPNDLTLYGKGFFKLKSPQGKDLYLKNLRLNLDQERFLSVGENTLLPKIKIPLEAKETKISDDGRVEAILKDGQKKFLGQLEVVSFPREESLSFDGFTYQETDKSGQPAKIKPGKLRGTFVKQGALETSNSEFPTEIRNFNQIKNRLSTIAQISQAINTSQREEFNSLRQTLQGI